MGIYFGLIVFILAVSMILNLLVRDKNYQKTLIVILSVTAMFLVCALKKDTVGRDISGYEIIYNNTALYSWSNFNYYYFEVGYLLLMKIFVLLFHSSFQLFMGFIYAFIFISLGFFIRHFSKNVTMSLLIYTCYIFFTFNLTGVRYSIALAFCMWAYILVDKHRRKITIIPFIILVLIAFLFHRSALLFFIVYIIYRFKWTPVRNLLYYLMLLVLALFRPVIMNYINNNIKDFGTFSLNFGGNIIFVIGICFIMFFLILPQKKYGFNDSQSLKLGLLDEQRYRVYLKVLCFTSLILILAGTGTNDLSRVAMYFLIVIILAIPEVISKFELQSRIIANISILMFFLAFYYITVLLPNAYDIIPYQFFWQG